MIKRVFVKNCCSSNDLINNFKSTNLILFSHCIFLRDTVTERDLTKLSKSTDKKRSDLSIDNFHYSFSNRYIKNT